MYTTIITNLYKGILTVTINRPDKLNALNTQVLQELEQVIQEIYSNPEILSAIITGAGVKAFVAGADITEFMKFNEADGKALAEKGQRIFSSIEQSPKPIIAAVNGFALGGGCELAMSCHFRVASENAKFGQPEINLGIIPGYGGTQRLTQLIGKGRSLELILSATLIDATTALQYGLINHIFPQEELMDQTKALLENINSKAPVAISQAIKSVNAVFDETQDGYATEATAFAACFATKDKNEGVSAFLEKRKAVFTGN